MENNIMKKMKPLSIKIGKIAKTEGFKDCAVRFGINMVFNELADTYKEAFCDVVLSDYLDDKLTLTEEQKVRIEELYQKKIERRKERIMKLLEKQP